MLVILGGMEMKQEEEVTAGDQWEDSGDHDRAPQPPLGIVIPTLKTTGLVYAEKLIEV